MRLRPTRYRICSMRLVLPLLSGRHLRLLQKEDPLQFIPRGHAGLRKKRKESKRRGIALLIDIGPQSGYRKSQDLVAGIAYDSSGAVCGLFHLGITSAPYISMPSSGMKATFSPCNMILAGS